MDLIGRQSAIDAVHKNYDTILDFKSDGRTVADSFEDIINALPPEQPEIIRCKDCKHFIRDDVEEYTPYGFYNTYFHAFCDKHWDKEQCEYIDVCIDDFCSRAERRTND